MSNYVFDPEAEKDFKSIYGYTLDTRGEAQAEAYKNALDACMQKAFETGINVSSPFAKHPEVKRIKCSKHYVFFLDSGNHITVLAIFHHAMDIPTRISRRLG